MRIGVDEKDRLTWNDAGNGGEAVRVDNAFFVVVELRESLFQFQMNINRSIESKEMIQLIDDARSVDLFRERKPLQTHRRLIL